MNKYEALSDRELDAVVAERVMGWKWTIAEDEPDNPLSWLEPPPFGGSVYGARKCGGTFDYFGNLLPSYSTDISAAWQVVEKAGLSVLFWDDNGTAKWQARRHVSMQDDTASGWRTNAARAICESALLAIDAQESK